MQNYYEHFPMDILEPILNTNFSIKSGLFDFIESQKLKFSHSYGYNVNITKYISQNVGITSNERFNFLNKLDVGLRNVANLSALIPLYAKKVVTQEPHLFHKTNEIPTWQLQDRLYSIYMQFNGTDKLSFVVPLMCFNNLTGCEGFLCLKDPRMKDNSKTPCDQKYEQILMTRCSYTSKIAFESYLDVEGENPKSIETGLLIYAAMFPFIVSIMYWVEHMAFAYQCVSSHTNVKGILLAWCASQLPGSYTKNQLNLLSCCIYKLNIVHLLQHPAILVSQE
jgi:hypothetical protein